MGGGHKPPGRVAITGIKATPPPAEPDLITFSFKHLDMNGNKKFSTKSCDKKYLDKEAAEKVPK